MSAEQTELSQEMRRIRDIPVIMVVEGRPMQPFDLLPYLNNPTQKSMRFSAELMDGSALPDGIRCSEDGLIKGTPKVGTAKKEPYRLLLTAQSDASLPLIFTAQLVVLDTAQAAKLEQGESLQASEIDQKTKKFWESFSKEEVINIEEILNREVRPEDIYWLLERFATLSVWNADDLSLADNGKLIYVANISDRYNVYDFDVVLLAVPKDLFDSKRSFVDANTTARALMYEVQRRQWKIIDLIGFDKMITAAEVETLQINDQLAPEQRIEVRCSPSVRDRHVSFLSRLQV